MFVARIVTQQQAAQTSARTNQSTTERPERPERPEQKERPEAGSRSSPPSADELREQIRQSIKAATDAANEAAQDAARNHVRIVNGVPMPPAAPVIHTTSDASEFANTVMPQVVNIANGFFVMCAVMVVGWPLARAFGRRIERRGEIASATPAVTEQLQRIEQAVDAMSIEVERISESQRFLAKLQSSSQPEHAALPTGDRR